MTRRTGTGPMEVSGLDMIIGEQASLTMLVDLNIILVSIFLKLVNGMILIPHCIPKDHYVSTILMMEMVVIFYKHSSFNGFMF